MDWNRIEGNWKQIIGKVKEKWGDLTDDDLNKIEGRRDQLEGKIQERYGISKDVVQKDRRLDEDVALIRLAGLWPLVRARRFSSGIKTTRSNGMT